MENLPAPIGGTVNITAESLPTLLQNGQITVEQAGEFLELDADQIQFAKLYLQLGCDELEAIAEVRSLNLSNRRQLEEARRISKRMLEHIGVNTLINAQLNSSGLNDEFALASLKHLISQNANKSVRLKAAETYLKITDYERRQEEKRKEKVFDFTRVSFDELQTLVSILKKAEVTNEHPVKPVYLPDNEINLNNE